MVLTTIKHADVCSTDATTTTEHSANTRKEVKDTRSNQEYDIQSFIHHAYYNLGDREHGNNMHRTSNSGLSIVIGNMSVVLIHVFPKG